MSHSKMVQPTLCKDAQVSHQQKNSEPESGVSLCIARVFNNISWKRIKDVFISLNWGRVDRVDVIHMGTYKRAYVHFLPGRWNVRNHEAVSALEAMQKGEEVKVLYDDPWFWKIGISRSQKPSEAPRPKPRPQVVIGNSGVPPPPVLKRAPRRSKTPPFSPTTPPHTTLSAKSNEREVVVYNDM